jgi:hypothetical protein
MTKKRPKPCCHAKPCAELDSVSFQHLVKVFSAFGRHTFHPRPQDGVFRCNLNKMDKNLPLFVIPTKVGIYVFDSILDSRWSLPR